jgi:uncharacterized membrane protein
VGIHCGTSNVSAIIVLIFVDVAVAGAVVSSAIIVLIFADVAVAGAVVASAVAISIDK